MSWKDGLSDSALQIASSNESVLRVMAGPGTGKSFALKRRVTRLLEEQTDPCRILAVTFTRNAAAGLISDLENLGIEGCEKLHTGTLHSFCFRLLKKQETFDYLGRCPRPLVSFSKSGALQFEGKMLSVDLSHVGEFGTTRECAKRIRAFEAAWARQQSEKAGWPQTAIDQEFQKALLSWLKFHNAMLIGEVVPEALKYLRDNPASEIRAAYDHVIVDEYQDLNKAEQTLIDLLAQNGSLAIVGDVDQSIYQFRFANPEGIEGFHSTHQNTFDVTLDQCRRCPTGVVNVANNLIKNNHPSAIPPRLVPKPDNPLGRIHTVQWKSIDDEVQGVCDFVRHLIDEQKFSAGEILILTPRRLFGYLIRNRLLQAGIGVHSFYHEEALESDAAQISTCLLSILSDHEDRVSLRFWLGFGDASSCRDEYSNLRAHCETTGASPWAALSSACDGSIDIPNVTNLIKRFKLLQAELESIRSLTLDELIDKLFPAGAEDRAEVREIALRYRKECQTAGDLVETIKSKITQPEMPEKGDHVNIMSFHKSKGLTYKAVIITSLLQGLMPNEKKDLTPVESRLLLEEQRRLFYVAITRCTDILVLSSVLNIQKDLAYRVGAKIGRGGNKSTKAISSSFLTELGPTSPSPQSGITWASCRYGF